MNYAIQQLRRMRAWHVVYALFVVVALAGATDGRAEDEADLERTLAPPAEIQLSEASWTYSKSVRVELASNELVRLETTIPLDEIEEPQLTLGIAKRVSRNWAVSFNVWAAL